jgi:hypothetical protein
VLAIVSSSAATGLDPDEPPLVAALGVELGGGAVSVEHWHDPAVDWSGFDTVLLRSTWDYIDHLDDFLAWTERVESVTRLVNPAAVVGWNTEKRYLTELESAGIPVVPTVFVAPGESTPPVGAPSVVKPSVGAGSNGARRCRPDEVPVHVEMLHEAGRTAMIQPYLDDIDERGETALCFLAGRSGGLEFSHAFRKGPILHVAEPAWDGDLFAREEITSRSPSGKELELARAVLELDCVTRHGALAYARVDLVPHAGQPVVMELELVEPSFYFHVAEGSAERAATAFARHLP